uniref:prolyl 4-hydroxylase subunit alpha-2-like n=1 Tax=Styela clava TaxID=7725 RepID=UPI00193A1579|nr:prolyl 4-hydroxylase subunit alpha-2-like [Styela clava]
MSRIRIFIILGFVNLTLGVKWSSSISTYKAMLKYENLMLERLHGQTISAQKALVELKQNIEQIQLEAKEIYENFEHYFEHPVRQLQLMNRYKYDWRELENRSKVPMFLATKLYGNVTKAMKVFPKHQDRVAARQALLRLEHTYKLDTRDLADGNIRGKLAGKTLSATDCANIAEAAHAVGRDEQCKKWNAESLSRLYAIGVNTKKFSSLFPRKYVNCSSNSDKPSLTDGTSLLYRELCNEEIVQKPKKCYLWTQNKNYWFVFQPVKTEILNYSPRIIRFYDVARDFEIDSVIKISKSILQWGYAGRENIPEDKNINITSPRVGHVAWLLENETYKTDNGTKDDAIVKSLSKRVRTIIGLGGTKADVFQVSHYGVGGQFLFHYDNFVRGSEGEKYDGNRIASFLLYLSDIPEGGYTAFKYPKVYAKPIKGSAIFWYNLLPDGEANIYGLHAGCPTLIGSKWIAVKWFHEKENGMSRNPKYYDDWRGD